MSKELDKIEADAIRMIEFFQEECRKQCQPYLKIISDVRSLRPRVYTIDGKTMVPITALIP